MRMNADKPANDLSRTIFTGLRLQTDAGMVMVHMADVSSILAGIIIAHRRKTVKQTSARGCLPLRFSNPNAHFRRATVLPEGVWDCGEGAAAGMVALRFASWRGARTGSASWTDSGAGEVNFIVEEWTSLLRIENISVRLFQAETGIFAADTRMGVEMGNVHSIRFAWN